MLKIEELHKRAEGYMADCVRKKESPTIPGFILFIEESQANNPKVSIVSLDKREKTRLLKELRQRQEQNKPVSPEEDDLLIT